LQNNKYKINDVKLSTCDSSGSPFFSMICLTNITVQCLFCRDSWLCSSDRYWPRWREGLAVHCTWRH